MPFPQLKICVTPGGRSERQLKTEETEDDNEKGFITVLTAAKITHTFNVIMQTGGAVCYDKAAAAAATTHS